MRINIKYKYSDYALFFIALASIAISYLFVFRNWSDTPVNLVQGDARDYYSYLMSLFIRHDFLNQAGNDWYLLNTGSGVINVHPPGVALLLLPFFLTGYLFAALFNFPVNGQSLPFELSIAVGALFYCLIGLIYVRKLLHLNNINDRITAFVLILLFFGTNILHYTLSEAVMSHIYSFSLVSVFLYHSCRYVLHRDKKNLFLSAIIFGLILLTRPNNIFILLSVFIWFKNRNECVDFFKYVFKQKAFYASLLLAFCIAFIQNIVWFVQSRHFFYDTYKGDGFYWLQPQLLKMLFGFDNGFFIYTPLALLFCAGLFVSFKENKFSFVATSVLILGLFYFFSSYWAYTYFDGIGIRVLVDYYALFALLGARLFSWVFSKKLAFAGVSTFAILFAFLNLIYCYQGNRGILHRSGMTYNKWKYIFLKTGKEYQDCLGGGNDLTPYASVHPRPILSKEIKFDSPFNYEGKEFGVGAEFDSLGFDSKRIFLKINLRRKEKAPNSSYNGLLCISVEDKKSKQFKTYSSCRINETPVTSCCEETEYNYTANIMADYKQNNRMVVYIWNKEKQAFTVDKFAVEVYNYNYQIN